MKIIKNIAYMVMFLTFGCYGPETENITLLSMNSKGTTKIFKIHSSLLESYIDESSQLLENEIPSSLGQPSTSNPIWEVEKLEVGFNLAGTVGLPLLKVGANGGYRLIFTPNKEGQL